MFRAPPGMEREIVVKRVLLIGGYGGFGARLARRLSDTADADTHIIVAGRDGAKANAFAASLANASAAVVDRNGDIAAALLQLAPSLVIDAAGPFQASSFAVPQACIAAGIDYLDLADARDFVVGFADLDEAAKAKNVALVTGASSVPALSGAVVRALMDGRGGLAPLTKAEQIDMVISASNKASSGQSVAKAALSYAGQPVWIWRGQQWRTKAGWSDLQRVTFFAPDGTRLDGRWIALADIPDHALMPDRVAGRPAVTFRAGTELCPQMTSLWLMAFLVRWRILRSLLPLAPLLLKLVHATKHWGGDRSAMHVIVKGWQGTRPVERRWTLIAEQGDGPEIPTLAAELLARKLLTGQVEAGAVDAGPLLALEEFQPLFDKLHLHHGISETPLPRPVYARAMGPAFDALPDAVRDMHSLVGDGGAEGEGTVERPGGLLARLFGRIVSMPPAGHYPLHVGFAVDQGKEHWTRNFGGHRFASELSQEGVDGSGQVAERFGPMRFIFALPSEAQGLQMIFKRWTLFGIPMPRFLAANITAREWQDELGRFNFDVAVAFPMIGRIVHYTGWLRKEAEG